jgi:HEAT repeat protein
VKATPESVRLLTDVTADPADRASAVSLLAADRRYDLERVLAALLRDDAALVRSQAILVLVGRWHRTAYIDDAIALLRSDPSWHVRSDAATALSWLALDTGEPEPRATALAALGRCVAEDPDPSVRERCERTLRELGADASA